MNNTIQNTLHLWKIPLTVDESALEHLQSLLTNEEKKNAAQFKFEKHRHRYIASHAATRIILADQLQQPIEKLIISATENGKPYIPNNPIFFNLSHSGDLAYIAITNQGDVGIDVEKIKPTIDALEIAKRFFHPLELKQFNEIPQEKHKDFFYYCWTGKEAFVKTKGIGITSYLSDFALEFKNFPDIKVIETAIPLQEFKDWYVYTFSVNEDHVTTVVCCETPSIIKHHEFYF